MTFLKRNHRRLRRRDEEEAFYLKAIIKDGSNLYVPKKFVRTCVPNFIFVYTRTPFRLHCV